MKNLKDEIMKGTADESFIKMCNKCEHFFIGCVLLTILAFAMALTIKFKSDENKLLEGKIKQQQITVEAFKNLYLKP